MCGVRDLADADAHRFTAEGIQEAFSLFEDCAIEESHANCGSKSLSKCLTPSPLMARPSLGLLFPFVLLLGSFDPGGGDKGGEVVEEGGKLRYMTRIHFIL